MPLTAPSLTITDSQNGGGGSATLTGGDAGATNVVKYARLTGSLGALTTANAGSRTGPGSVSFTLSQSGLYLFAVESTLLTEVAWSSWVYARLSDSADSLHEQLQQAALDVILALSLDGIGSNVKRIKLPAEKRIADLAIPACLLMTFDQSEDYLDERSPNAHDDTAFPILVAFLRNDEGADETDAQITLWRQQVRRSFRAQRLPVSRHYTTEIGQGPVVSVAVEGKELQASTMQLRLICRENRGLS